MVPPWNSCGCNLPSRALAANSLMILLISTSPFLSACGTIGVIKPLSVATATEQSTESYLKMNTNYYLLHLMTVFSENFVDLLSDKSIMP